MKKKIIASFGYIASFIIGGLIIGLSMLSETQNTKKAFYKITQEKVYFKQEYNCYYMKAFSVGFDRGFISSKENPCLEYKDLKAIDNIKIISEFKCLPE